jgi:hypothetical protein
MNTRSNQEGSCLSRRATLTPFSRGSWEHSHMAGATSDLFSYVRCLGWVSNGTTCTATVTVKPCSSHTKLIFMWSISIVFGRWDRGFESHLRHGCFVCLRLFCVCVVLCAGGVFATGWSLVQGVLPSVKKKIITEVRGQCPEWAGRATEKK